MGPIRRGGLRYGLGGKLARDRSAERSTVGGCVATRSGRHLPADPAEGSVPKALPLTRRVAAPLRLDASFDLGDGSGLDACTDLSDLPAISATGSRNPSLRRRQ